MGTISDKLTYLNTTKSQLKSMISYGYPLSNETFRQYVGGVFKALINSMSDTLNPTWNNLPKLSITPSTSLSINNTIKAPMRINLQPNELSQASTPTPSSPQDIHTISGDNNIIIGKNLFNVYDKVYVRNSQMYITINNNVITFTNDYTYANGYAWWNIPVEVGETYTISYGEKSTNAGNNYLSYSFSNDAINTHNASFADFPSVPNADKYKTVQATAKYLILCLRSSNGVQSYTISDIQLEKGSTASAYSEYKGYIVNLGIKNELDINSTLINNRTNYNVITALQEDGSYWVYGTPSQQQIYWTANDNNKQLFKAGTYTFSVENEQNKEARLYIKGATSGTNTTQDTLRGETTFTYNEDFYVYNGSVILTTGQYFNGTFRFNLVKGTKYKNTTKEQYEYCKIGNYADRIFKNISTDEDYDNTKVEGAWYIKKNITKKIFDGNEDWYIATATHNGYTRFRIDSTLVAPSVLRPTNAFCSNFELGDTGANTEENILDWRANGLIFLNTNVASTPADLKTWLASNSIITYYQMVSPTYTQITGTLASQLEAIYNSQSKDGQTNISQVNNDLPFVINASALQDLSTL